MENTDQAFDLRAIKEELVPNFQYLEMYVQKQIANVLTVIMRKTDKTTLQKFSKMGLLQEAPLLRSHIWKMLLQTMSFDPKSWQKTRCSHKQLYATLIEKFLGQYLDDEDLLEIKQQKLDGELWDQITLDTKRTHSTLNFFQKQIEHTSIYTSKKSKNSDVLTRILYIWAQVNQTVRYVQGMNQILAPLYYLEFQKYTLYSESEVFFMFASIMTFVIDMHIKEMDNEEQGIIGRMITVNRYLKVIDFQLWKKLDSEGIVPQYYSFRWLALLLAQEFGLYETMRLWDNLLAYDGHKRYFFLYCCCIGILKLHKQMIMKNDFTTILPKIQRLKNLDVNQIIELGLKLYMKYRRVNLEHLYQQLQKQISLKDENALNFKQKSIKQKKWNYKDLLKYTSDYLFKWGNNTKQT